MKPRQGSGVRVALSSQWVGTFLISQLGCPTATFTWTGEKTPPQTLNGHKGREQTGRWNQVCDLGLKSPGAKGHCCFIGSDQQGRRELLQEGL